MTDILAGTKKGLFVLRGEAGAPFEIVSRFFAGEPVDYATRDPRTGRYFAAMTSPFYGPKLLFSDDLNGEWSQAQGLALPADGEETLTRIWTVVPG